MCLLFCVAVQMKVWKQGCKNLKEGQFELEFLTNCKYSWSLKSTGLHCMVPLTCGLLSINMCCSTIPSIVDWICGYRRLTIMLFTDF